VSWSISRYDPHLSSAIQLVGDTLSCLTLAIEKEHTADAMQVLESSLSRLGGVFAEPQFSSEHLNASSANRLIWNQLAKTIGEIKAMAMALRDTQASEEPAAPV
jgi:hypothetical protein